MKILLLTYFTNEKSRASHFEESMLLGPMIFVDTAPLLLNSIVVIVLGNILSSIPQTCSIESLKVYVDGLIVLASAFAGILAYMMMQRQNSISIRIPLLLLLGWNAATAIWTFVGFGVLIEAGKVGCSESSPSLFWFSVIEMIVNPIFVTALMLTWTNKGFSSILQIIFPKKTFSKTPSDSIKSDSIQSAREKTRTNDTDTKKPHTIDQESDDDDDENDQDSDDEDNNSENQKES
jgi:hypothetical protein